MKNRHQQNFDSSPEVQWEKEEINEARQEDVFEKVHWWREGKSISGKLKLLILLDLQQIKICHACLHVGMVSLLTYSE
jgi:hypothetical protein